jgi:hypothetical protein
MKHTQPIVKETVGPIGIEGAPKNRAPDTGPPQHPKNGYIGYPGKQGQTPGKERIGKGSGKKKDPKKYGSQVDKKDPRHGGQGDRQMAWRPVFTHL